VENKRRFKKGERVRVVADAERLRHICCINKVVTGSKGVLRQYVGETLPCQVRVDGGSLYWFDERDLESIEVKPTNPKTKKQYGHPRFYEMLEAMAELHSRKNHDYAGTSDPLKNLRACERLELDPFMGVMVRLQDKWSRLEEFVKSGKLMVKGESVKDTLMDNAVYSILAIILYEEQEVTDRTKPVPGGY